MRKILVASSVAYERKFISELLRRSGYVVVGETSDMPTTLRRARTLDCDLVIVDSGLDGGKGIKAASIIDEDGVAEVLLIVDRDMNAEANRFHCVVKPLDQHTILPAVRAAILFQDRQAVLRQEIRNLSDKLETRKLLDQAKGVVMSTMRITEPEAHRLIQKEAMNRGWTLKQMASEILRRHSSPR